MSKSNIRALMESALQHMEQKGASKKMLKSYRTTGFGRIFRHFEKIGHDGYSQTLIDEYISQTRSEYERREISKWTWNQVRRGGELLKHFHCAGNLDMPPCVQWEALHNPLHREPTKDEMNDHNNVFTLLWQTKKEMQKFRLTPKTTSNYLYDGFDRIMYSHIDRGLTQYSPEITAQLAENARTDYEKGDMCHSVYRNIRRIVALVNEFYETRTLTWRYLPAYGLREPQAYYARLLLAFSEDAEKTGGAKLSTIKQSKSAARRFIFELEEAGFDSFNGINAEIINKCVTKLSRNYAGGLGALLFGIRSFLKFLYTDEITTIDLSMAIPEMVAQRKPIRAGFSENEISKLFVTIDRTTAVGLRDYAIMMLATQTGLRACDIANLKRQDIDWRTNEIRIVQSKTNRALSLPLPVESGNAIAHYLIHARPDCDLEYIFLCKARPLRPINNRSMSSIVSRYMFKAEITQSSIKRRGFHSFRRSFGKRLLESETSLDMLSELLGHTVSDSTKPYIAIDESGLKKCALSLVFSTEAGGLA